MNNEIILHTNKGEYLPGETVYGAVYLHICTPTEARGVKVTFKGLETCSYDFNCEGKYSLKNETAHVDFSDIVLYSQKDIFEFGSYVFPFKFDLPKVIPGSFFWKGENKESSWAVTVTYEIRVHAIGSSAIQATQTVIVYQAQEKDLRESMLGTAQDCTYSPSKFSFASRKIHITAKLLNNFTETGSNMQVRLMVTNPTKTKIIAFNMLLLRYLTLNLRDGGNRKKFLHNMECVDDVIHVAPEYGPFEVQKVSGAGEIIQEGNSAIDRIQIPLKELGTEEKCYIPVPPTAMGKHVKNQYHIEITVTFDNGHRQTLTVPVPGILPKKNQEWLQWNPPSWTYQAEVKLSDSLFSVSQQKLRTEAFAGLPTFQIL